MGLYTTGLAESKTRSGSRVRLVLPAWRKDVPCHMCYACLNFCPKRSVQIKGIRGVARSFSPDSGRYSHPYATANDIAAQKRPAEDTD